RPGGLVRSSGTHREGRAAGTQRTGFRSGRRACRAHGKTCRAALRPGVDVMTALPTAVPARKLGLVIDLDVCVGCHACVISCKEWNTGGYGAALSDQDPYGADVSGTFLNRIHSFEVVPDGEVV